ncbi:MAG: hypothetical protein GF350_13965, partial [Chitinivibrionales bacterium]|nr:hypothetical protein [Chitinivibrionales bacterium]
MNRVLYAMHHATPFAAIISLHARNLVIYLLVVSAIPACSFFVQAQNASSGTDVSFIDETGFSAGYSVVLAERLDKGEYYY